MNFRYSPEFRHLPEHLQAAVQEAVALIHTGDPVVTLATIESDKGAEAIAYRSLDGLTVHWYVLMPTVVSSGTSMRI